MQSDYNGEETGFLSKFLRLGMGCSSNKISNSTTLKRTTSRGDLLAKLIRPLPQYRRSTGGTFNFQLRSEHSGREIGSRSLILRLDNRYHGNSTLRPM